MISRINHEIVFRKAQRECLGHHSSVVARRALLADVPVGWLADFNSVVLCVAALLGQVLFVEGTALGVWGVADLRQWTLCLGGGGGDGVLRPVNNVVGSWSGGLNLGLLLDLDSVASSWGGGRWW